MFSAIGTKHLNEPSESEALIEVGYQSLIRSPSSKAMHSNFFTKKNEDLISQTKVSQRVEIGAEYKRQQEKFEVLAIPNTNTTSKHRKLCKAQLLNNYLGITSEIDESMIESSLDASEIR